MNLLSAAKVFPGFTHMQDQAALRFCKKSSDILRTLRISHKNLACANPEPFKLLKQIPSIPAPLRQKKKSKVMRNNEKNKWNQKSSTLPLSIKSIGAWLKFAAVILGFYMWKFDFIWMVLGFVFCYDFLRGILSCLISLATLIGLFYFLFTHIF